MANDVPAVAAAVRIIEQLAAESPHAVSPGALAGDLGINRSTCYNILATLQRSGWVTSLGARAGWTLGPGLLAITGVSHESTRAVIQEELDVACRKLGYVVFTAQQDGSGGYTVTAISDPRRGVRVIVDVGDRFPFSAPALMQSLLRLRPAGRLPGGLTRARHRAVHRAHGDQDRRTRRGLRPRPSPGLRHQPRRVQPGSGRRRRTGVRREGRGDDGGRHPGLLQPARRVQRRRDRAHLRDAAERITRRTGGQFPPTSGTDGTGGVAETA